MTLAKYVLEDGDIVKGVVNSKGWLEWILKESDGQTVTGLSRPGSFKPYVKPKK